MNIQYLNLYCSNIKRIRSFYSQVLGFEEIEARPDLVTYKIGSSKLTFTYAQNTTPYHFAINIPFNKIEESHRWLADRVDLIPDGANEIINFNSWNAKAIYFYDPDQNIVEFIARKNLNVEVDDPFSPRHFCEISEIGIAVSPINEIVSVIMSKLNLTDYRGASDRFTALGTETGLFICIDAQLKKWYPPMDDAFASPFDAVVNVNAQCFQVVFDGKSMQVSPL